MITTVIIIVAVKNQIDSYPDYYLSHSLELCCDAADKTQKLDKECEMEKNCLVAVHTQIPIWHGIKGAGKVMCNARIVKYIEW